MEQLIVCTIFHLFIILVIAVAVAFTLFNGLKIVASKPSKSFTCSSTGNSALSCYNSFEYFVHICVVLAASFSSNFLFTSPPDLLT